MHTTLRIITYTFLLALSMCWAYSFKPVEAQAQKSKPVRGSIGSVMSMTGLAMIAPTKDSALVSVNQAYFVNNQWYSAIFMYVKTDTRPANSSRVYINVTGRTGAWNVYKFGLDYSDVFGLPNILTGILSRASTDSIGLVNEVSRAKAAEGLKANTSYANALSARQTADSIRLVNEVGRATTAEAGKLSASDAAATFQVKGTYLASETDPLSVPKTRTINGYPLTSNVTLGKSDVGLSNVDNTADASKPVSTAALAALALKEDLSNKQTAYVITNTSTTQYPSMAVLQSALTGYIKNVLFGGGVASFTVPITLLGGQNMTVVVPLNVTFPDGSYSLSSPLLIGSGGINLLGGTLTLVSVTKGVSSVSLVIKNNSVLSVAINGTAEVTALKVIQ